MKWLWRCAALAVVLAWFHSPAAAVPYVYVAAFQVGRIAVMDAATNELVAVLEVGGFPSIMAADHAGRRLYVRKFDLAFRVESIVVIDLERLVVLREFRPERSPFSDMAVSPDDRELYLLYDGPEGEGGIIVYDTRALKRVRMRLGLAARPKVMTFSPKGDRIFFADGHKPREFPGCDVGGRYWCNLNVYWQRPGLGAGGAFHEIGDDVRGIAVHPNGRRIYVAHIDTRQFNGTELAGVPRGFLSVVDMPYEDLGRQMARILLGTDPLDEAEWFPTAAAISPDGRRVYVVRAGTTGAVAVVDTERLEQVGQIAVAKGASQIAISRDGRKAFVAGGAYERVEKA